jgi:hypothetical protein
MRSYVGKSRFAFFLEWFLHTPVTKEVRYV